MLFQNFDVFFNVNTSINSVNTNVFKLDYRDASLIKFGIMVPENTNLKFNVIEKFNM